MKLPSLSPWQSSVLAPFTSSSPFLRLSLVHPCPVGLKIQCLSLTFPPSLFHSFSLPSSHLPFSTENLTLRASTATSWRGLFTLDLSHSKAVLRLNTLPLSYCLSFSLTREKNSFFYHLNLAGSGFVIAISAHGIDRHVGPAHSYPSGRLFPGRGSGRRPGTRVYQALSAKPRTDCSSGLVPHSAPPFLSGGRWEGRRAVSPEMGTGISPFPALQTSQD